MTFPSFSYSVSSRCSSFAMASSSSSFLSSIAKDCNPSSLLARLLLLPTSPLPSSTPIVLASPESLRRTFDHFDANKDGKISPHELRRSLYMFNIPVNDAELRCMIDEADANRDGGLDFSEFFAFYHLLSDESSLHQRADQSAQSEEDSELRHAFRVFDKDGNGFISAEELQSVLESMGLEQGRKLVDCHRMIQKVDADGDGQVSFDEFKRMMLINQS